MAGFLIALVIVLLTGIGARDQILLTEMSRASGPRRALLASAVATAWLSTALAAWAGWSARAQFSAHARVALAGVGLVMAGARLLPTVRMRVLKEPTQSLGAAAIVLFVVQIGDASRISILALALSGLAVPAAGGGALGSALTLAIGWRGGTRLLTAGAQLRHVRQVCGVLLMLAAVGYIDRFCDH